MVKKKKKKWFIMYVTLQLQPRAVSHHGPSFVVRRFIYSTNAVYLLSRPSFFTKLRRCAQGLTVRIYRRSFAQRAFDGTRQPFPHAFVMEPMPARQDRQDFTVLEFRQTNGAFVPHTPTRTQLLPVAFLHLQFRTNLFDVGLL